jgi:hypothetical protein
MHALAQSADMCPSFFGAGQQLLGGQRRPSWAIFILDAMTPALFPKVLAQQLSGERVEKTDMRCIPLHSNTPADPARRCPIVCGFDFDAAVQMHGSFAVLVESGIQWVPRLKRSYQARSSFCPPAAVNLIRPH